jgi:hypothetical protein
MIFQRNELLPFTNTREMLACWREYGSTFLPEYMAAYPRR